MPETNAKFIQYLKYLLKEGDISTRELSRAINKSSSYISQLLTGKIKRIDFNTAYAILKAINQKYQFISSEENLTSFLSDNFSIEPEELLQRRIEEVQALEEKREKLIKEIKNKLLTEYDLDNLKLIIMLFSAIKNEEFTSELKKLLRRFSYGS